MSGARDHLDTERANPRSADLDLLTTEEALDVFQAEDEAAVRAVAAVRDELARLVDLTAERLARGGRLLYVGAGTSGRLGVLDAAECPPTFLSAPGQVAGVIAGGSAALERAVEGAEDSAEAGAADLDALAVGAHDVVLGISASGGAPYVSGALARAREAGALTAFLACVPRAQAPDEADVSLRVLSGPEVLAGSTRLKAGTVTKLVLNRLSTLVMVRLGKVHGNLMVDVDTRANEKLVERGTSLVATLTGLERAQARALLERADGRVKVAAVMHARGLGAAQARAALEAAGGLLRRALA